MLTARIEELITAMPAAQGVNADGTTGPHAGQDTGVAARQAQHTAKLAVGVIQAGSLAGGRTVDGVDRAALQYGVSAVASRSELLFPPGEVLARGELEQLTG
jgi:hypothetical protein